MSSPVQTLPGLDGQPVDLADPRLYLNRELGQVAFIQRVLAMAEDEAIPLLERLRYLTICSTLVDEFHEIRVSGVKHQLALGLPAPGPDGLTPLQTLREIGVQVQALVAEQYRALNEVLLPALAGEGIHLLRRRELTDAQAKWTDRYFREQVLPVLTPIALDPAHPFPNLLNKSLNFLVGLDGVDAFGRTSNVAVVQVPRCLPRVLALPPDVRTHPHEFIAISAVVHRNIGKLFRGMKVRSCDQFRVTRNSDLWVDEEEVDDLLTALEGELPARRYGQAVRLEVASSCPEELSDFLLEHHDLQDHDLYRVNGPVNLHRLDAVVDLVDRPDLCFPPFKPSVPEALSGKRSFFDALDEGDVLLHHPYQSFGPVAELVRRAAVDPEVLAIKQTLYRTDTDSELVEALLGAARAGKAVTVLVELRARFDEASNIRIANRFQQAGVNVVYGVVGYKTHAKMLMIVRRGHDGELHRYVHLGTGNYHAKTARLYTDFGLLTSDKETGRDVDRVFQQLTGLGKSPSLKRLLIAPFQMLDALVEKIEREADHARAGRPAQVQARMNALTEPQVIRALYAASAAGVRIDLVVRGICRLRPGMPGISDNIRVRSTLGRFLEHSRIYVFANGGEREVWLSSADWMERNLRRRVETSFPMLEPELAERVVHEGIEVHFEDHAGAWELGPDGQYTRPSATGAHAQARLIDELATS